jgi:hypothetical protein
MIVSEIRICYDKATATTFDYNARLIQSFVAREYGLVDLPRQFLISFPINSNFMRLENTGVALENDHNLVAQPSFSRHSPNRAPCSSPRACPGRRCGLQTC